MEPEAPNDVTAPAPPATVLEPTPTADTPALVLNDAAALQVRLDTYSEAREVLVKWLLSKLVAGIDYTLIHRKIGPRGQKTECPNAGNMIARVCEQCGGKSTLCKPGSEKICGLLQLRPRFRRDAETWEMLGSEPGVLALVCELVTASGVVVAEGRGARHRDMDYGDLNKSVKMTQKSAQTDAVLRLAGLSEIFTQDLEDMGGAYTGATDDNGGEFQAPRGKSGATAPAAKPGDLEAQLRTSVERAKEAKASAQRPVLPTRPVAPRPMRPPTTPPRSPQGTPAPPSDALSPARINRLMALLHEAIRSAEVPEEQHEGVFDSARAYLVEWVGRTQGRERLGDCSWRSYDALCAEVPNAVDAALGGQGPAPRPRPRLVQKRSYAAPRPFARRGY